MTIETSVRFIVDVPGSQNYWADTRLPLSTILRLMKAVRRKDEHLMEMISIVECEIKARKTKP